MGKTKFNSQSHSPFTSKKRKFKFSLSISSKLNKKKINISIKNPQITAINDNSKFIFDIDTFETYFSKIKNKNNLKLNESEIKFLESKINEINQINEERSSFSNIQIPLKVYEKINSFTPKIIEQDEVVKYIKNLINENKNKEFLSCRRIAYKYFIDTGKKISKTKVHNILRNKLNFRFLKSVIKNDKLNDNRNILISLCFIKIIVKCMKLNYKIIYIDESRIQCNNNNFKTWRSKEETIYYRIGNNKKSNLIAALDENELLYYLINEKNTNEAIFLDFMKGLKQKIEEKGITKYVIVLDNLSVHKSNLLLKYYLENDINILFNSPYQSPFNSIELLFRLIKRKIYQKLYSSTEEAIEEMEKILNEKVILNKGLEQNFRETLETYYKYSIKYKDLNLNNYEYE